MLTVYVSPNRENLRFCVKKVKKEKQLDELQWLIDLMKQHGKDKPKTLQEIFLDIPNLEEMLALFRFSSCRL